MRRFLPVFPGVMMLMLFTLIVNAQEQTTEKAEAKRAQTLGPKKGSLVIVGGGGNPEHMHTILKKFVELAGGEKARIIVVPTAATSDPNYDYENYHMGKRLERVYNVKDVTIVHTHDREEANTQAFIKPIQTATGIWFSGGRQWRFTKAYRGTLAEKAFRGVLERGGVIGGSSAGATIQGSFLARGDSRTNTIMVGDYQHGFGYIQNIAIDQHIVPRRRQLDMLKILEDSEKQMKPEFNREAMLGLGVDEDTAIVVKGNQFEVIGKPSGLVFVYDPRKWTAKTLPHDKYITLKPGEWYHLKHRKQIKPVTNPAPDADAKKEAGSIRPPEKCPS